MLPFRVFVIADPRQGPRKALTSTTLSDPLENVQNLTPVFSVSSALLRTQNHPGTPVYPERHPRRANPLQSYRCFTVSITTRVYPSKSESQAKLFWRASAPPHSELSFLTPDPCLLITSCRKSDELTLIESHSCTKHGGRGVKNRIPGETSKFSGLATFFNLPAILEARLHEGHSDRPCLKT
jgi:hypothetical protein